MRGLAVRCRPPLRGALVRPHEEASRPVLSSPPPRHASPSPSAPAFTEGIKQPRSGPDASPLEINERDVVWTASGCQEPSADARDAAAVQETPAHHAAELRAVVPPRRGRRRTACRVRPCR
ncbi:hypothetical protein PAHAL_2G382400 [Panicum hallii]|uniref:Uncharacterized protein n=1 Tax=Panicum hallii TaxID=206008 RepID=A0A2T8KRY4_9POAL|nr:hypothetical protein PAHAL_2G382400 [Panicum hallii]